MDSAGCQGQRPAGRRGQRRIHPGAEHLRRTGRVGDKWIGRGADAVHQIAGRGAAGRRAVGRRGGCVEDEQIDRG